METVLISPKKKAVIAGSRPTVLIGERINPTGKKKLTAALQAGDMDIVRQEALDQVKAGADVLDVNAGVPGADEAALLKEMVQVVSATMDVPLCIDSNSPDALKAALAVYKGKPLVNSVNGEEQSLSRILPLVKEYGAAVVGLTMDEAGIPDTADKRLSIAVRIVERAEKLGIPREDIVIDCLTLTVGADSKAGLVTLETVRRVKQELGTNMTLGAGNVSFGLPDRSLLNGIFLAMVIAAGVTCPIVDVAKVRSAVLAADLVLGRDDYASRYIQDFRGRQRNQTA
ncbi:MAG: dihydropteroate synthase [Dehalococcoidia bacterium]|nr:dihydropteroate synthase [Dehalococcoidia bacterium]